MVEVELRQRLVRRANFDPSERAAGGVEADDVADRELHFAGRYQRFHLRDRRWRGAELVAAVNECHRFRVRREFEYPIEGRVAAAEYDHFPAVMRARVRNAIEDTAVVQVVDAVDAQGHRLERADAAGDDDSLATQFRPGARRNGERA